MTDIFSSDGEWFGADAWLKDPVSGPDHYDTFCSIGFDPRDAGKLACLAVEQGYFNIVRDLQSIEGVDLSAFRSTDTEAYEQLGLSQE